MANALRCPHCSLALHPARFGEKLAWMCPSCSGLAFNLSVLREEVEPATVAQFWLDAQRAAFGAVGCPSCQRAQRAITHASARGELEIDVCVPCQLIWLDHGELEPIRHNRPRRGPERVSSVPQSDKGPLVNSAVPSQETSPTSISGILEAIVNIIFTTLT